MTALAHPTRRAILQRVMRHESRVTDLAAPFDLSLNAVSKHIRVLETANLVKRRRVWREHYVSFNPQPLDELAKWIGELRSVWEQRFDALDAMLKEEIAAERAGAAPEAAADPIVSPPASTNQSPSVPPSEPQS